MMQPKEQKSSQVLRQTFVRTMWTRWSRMRSRVAAMSISFAPDTEKKQKHDNMAVH